jgi:hypothetical protein
LLTPFLALYFHVIDALGRYGHQVDVTRLFLEYVIPDIPTFAEEVIRCHFLHALCAVFDPSTVLARCMMIRDLEMIE